ncbi:MAG: sigma-70 family RNA polymerase sigma factor [Oscillospiraceae bacterium]|nr:sigma-70 family RNA polymerase sigma factor [Oscillospiraceae bacterium]
MTQQQYCQQAEALKGKLYRTALLYLGSETAALDAVDEAVYKGLLSCKKLRQPEFFTTWLTRILLNVCASEYRRRAREHSMAELPETAQEQFDALPLKEAISKLPRQLKDVILLRYFSGLTLEETAQVLDIPRTTVSTRQKKALTLLRVELTEEVQL